MYHKFVWSDRTSRGLSEGKLIPLGEGEYMPRGQEWECASGIFPGSSKCFCLWSYSGAPCGGPRSINHVVMPNCFTLRILDVLAYGRRGTS